MNNCYLIHPSSLIPPPSNLGTWRNRNLARLRAKEQVGGSNPLVPSIFFGFVAQLEPEHKNSTLEVAGSNPAEVFYCLKTYSPYFWYVLTHFRIALSLTPYFLLSAR
jgi:hypothetical protein